MQKASTPTPEFRLPPTTRRSWFWLTVQTALWMICPLWLRYRSRGAEHVPAEGGALLLVNHTSFLDPFMAALPVPRPVHYLARDTLSDLPVASWVLRNAETIPINRSAASTATIKYCVRHLEGGFLVGIFPEGTRSEDGKVGPLKPGFVALLRRAKCPVVPVGIAGAFESFPRGARWVRPGRVRVVFGEPWTAEELEPYKVRGKEGELLEMVRERMVAAQEAAEEWRTR